MKNARDPDHSTDPEKLPETLHDQVADWLNACARTMSLCASTERQSEMVQSFLSSLKCVSSREFTANPLPCLENLQWVKDMKLAREFQGFAKSLPWQISPRTIDHGQDVAVCDFSQMFGLGSVVAGLIYVDANKSYPEHNHHPDELYLLISGTGCWRWGGNSQYQTITAGNVIYNYSWNWHGVKAGPTPVLAMYLLC